MEVAMEEADVRLEITRMWSRAEVSRPTIEEVYDQYSRSLYRYALALTSSADDAEDAVQDVFVRLSREKRLKDIESLKAYLFKATRNAAYSILRSRGWSSNLHESLCQEFDTKGIDIASRSVSSMALCEAFVELPIEQREVFVLKVYDGMTFQEIARTVGQSMGTVTSRYRYGIARLRQALEDKSDG
jgi:RNA polymerase sigma-70 factor (ECF subfamily)